MKTIKSLYELYESLNYYYRNSNNNLDNVKHKNKLLEFSNSYIKLTPKGRLLSNEVFLKFF